MSEKKRPTVTIIGAGRMGTALALALDARGYAVRAVVSRTRESAARAANLMASPPLALTATELDKIPKTEILIIAAPDDSIAEIAKRLAEQSTLQNKASGKSSVLQRKAESGLAEAESAAALAAPSFVALHTSGALSSEILAPLRACGYAVGSMHPLVSVSDALTGARAFSGAYFCVEGDREAARTARQIVKNLGGESFTIPTLYKPLYHAAAVVTAGHTVALFDLAIEMLKVCGLRADEAQKILLPLLSSALKNLETQTPERALTGTFARGDVATIKKHLVALQSDERARAALELYKLLGLHALEMARRRGVDEKRIEEMEKTVTSDE